MIAVSLSDAGLQAVETCLSCRRCEALCGVFDGLLGRGESIPEAEPACSQCGLCLSRCPHGPELQGQQDGGKGGAPSGQAGLDMPQLLRRQREERRRQRGWAARELLLRPPYAQLGSGALDWAVGRLLVGPHGRALLDGALDLPAELPLPTAASGKETPPSGPAEEGGEGSLRVLLIAERDAPSAWPEALRAGRWLLEASGIEVVTISGESSGWRSAACGDLAAGHAAARALEERVSTDSDTGSSLLLLDPGAVAWLRRDADDVHALREVRSLASFLTQLREARRLPPSLAEEPTPLTVVWTGWDHCLGAPLPTLLAAENSLEVCSVLASGPSSPDLGRDAGGYREAALRLAEQLPAEQEGREVLTTDPQLARWLGQERGQRIRHPLELLAALLGCEATAETTAVRSPS